MFGPFVRLVRPGVPRAAPRRRAAAPRPGSRPSRSTIPGAPAHHWTRISPSGPRARGRRGGQFARPSSRRRFASARPRSRPPAACAARRRGAAERLDDPDEPVWRRQAPVLLAVKPLRPEAVLVAAAQSASAVSAQALRHRSSPVHSCIAGRRSATRAIPRSPRRPRCRRSRARARGGRPRARRSAPARTSRAGSRPRRGRATTRRAPAADAGIVLESGRARNSSRLRCASSPRSSVVSA